MRTSALVVLILSCAPAHLLAQGEPPTGDVIVTVRSESGTPLAEAEVRSDGRQALTDAQGIARLALPAGRRQVTAARIGFEPAAIGVEVPPDR